MSKQQSKQDWAMLSDEEIKEYLKVHNLRVDTTKYAPAKKTYSLLGALLTAPLTLGLSDRFYDGVCPHCGWGISATHAIGAFRALTKCNECGNFAMLDRKAERFFAVVPDQSTSKRQRSSKTKRATPEADQNSTE